MANEIVLVRKEPTETFSTSDQHSWPLEVEATSNKEGLSSKIFVWHENAPGSAYRGDRFSCVASTQQMEDLPEDQPADEGDLHIPFYRKSTLLVDCRSPQLRLELWEKIKADVEDLITNWVAMEDTIEVETVTITPTT